MGERVSIDTVKVDLENAFTMWHEECWADDEKWVEAARARVFAFLAQVEADQRQLAEALKACHLLAESIKDREVARARRMAREVIMSRGTHVNHSGQVITDPWTRGGAKSD